jgi:hypothetical protein
MSDKRFKPYKGQALSTKVQPFRDRKTFEQKRHEVALKGHETRKKGQP